MAFMKRMYLEQIVENPLWYNAVQRDTQVRHSLQFSG
jgi:hypothetical protein